MKVTDKMLKSVKEVNYLNVENTGRYRSIIRLMFLYYEKMKYWMYQEEIYNELKEDEYFSEYTIEQCQQDLSTLVSWGNLLTIQDTRKVTTIEEFKNKIFRYQLSEYAVEIERMVVHLENLFVEGASLEPTLLESICHHFIDIKEFDTMSDEKIYGWWEDLKNDFVRLNQSYQDYMRTLNSVKAEKMMQTKEFLIFKDKLIDYLRSFVKSLQLNVGAIEKYICDIDKDIIEQILEKVVQYRLNIPNIDIEIDEEQIRDNIYGRWESIVSWFVAKNDIESEALKVFDTTNEIIRKITRYASRITEIDSNAANRREEYAKIAQMFEKCETLNDAHKLSSCVFGIEKTLHIKGEFFKGTESINASVFDEKPYVVTVQPRIRTYHEKTKRNIIVDKTEQKKQARIAEVKKMEEERKLLKSYIKDDRLEFAKLPEITPQIRDVFLLWLSKALEHKNLTAKTEDGKKYYIEENKGKRCTVRCTDGEFVMPEYTLVFEEAL